VYFFLPDGNAVVCLIDCLISYKLRNPYRYTSHMSHVVVTWCLYVSWILLFSSIVCIFKWLNVQPHLIAMRRSVLSAEQSNELVAMEKREKYACVAIKTLLIGSIILLCAHFVLVAI